MNNVIDFELYRKIFRLRKNNVIDFELYRKIFRLRKNNAILEKALSLFDYDKAKFSETLKQYDYQN